MTTYLDSNIEAYNDNDRMEMEQAIMASLEEVESYNGDNAASILAFVPGKINEELTRKLVGRVEEVNTNVNDGVRLCEGKTFNEFYTWIRTIDPLSDT